MKRFFNLLMSLLVLTNLYSQDLSSPVKYLGSVTDEILSLEKAVFKYVRISSKSKNDKRIEKQRQSLISTIDKMGAEIEAFDAYGEDNSLVEAATEFLSIYSAVVSEDYDNLIDMQAIKDQSYDFLETYIIADREANAKLEQASVAFASATEEFADSHNITLLDGQTDTGRKLAKAGEVIDYVNPLSLSIARLNFEEGYVIEAMNRNDINGMQQHINSMQSFIQEEEEKINNTEGYMGDSKLKYAAKKLLEFYKDQAEVQLPKAVDFFLISEEFELKTEKLEAIKPRKRTQKMIDEYNGLVNSYNNQLNGFNGINERSNQKRSELWVKWEQANNDFMQKHIPG